jgi:hypothetical protein
LKECIERDTSCLEFLFGKLCRCEIRVSVERQVDWRSLRREMEG